MFLFKKKLPKVKNTLATALQIAINALEQGTFKYDWHDHTSCNCGIVVNAMYESQNAAFRSIQNACLDTGRRNSRVTWKMVCQDSCSVTGLPMTEVFQKLHEMGLQPKDIVHLEYMDNPAILKESGISTDGKEYYKNKYNLIQYLKAWLRIITNTAQREEYTQKQQLEAELLIATAFKKYDESNKIKLQLANLN